MKTLTIILLGFVLTATGLYAQGEKNTSIDTKSYLEEAEVAPELIGGIAELAKQVKYPKEAAEAGIQGTVLVAVYLGKSGSIDALEVKKSTSDILSQAALDAVKNVRFKPGMVDGKPVKAQVIVPVKFRLK
ncbi:MAG: energy transducer TonB [Bacteroidetes bacterium]|nr:energy transducer TonB [Bacteroidota bacterium]